MVELDLGAQRSQALHVEVDGPEAYDAAAGERDLGVAALREERPQDADRGAHLRDELVLGARVLLALDLADEGRGVALLDLDAQVAEDRDLELDVLQGERHVLEDGLAFAREERRREQGQRRVLGAAYGDAARELLAPFDDELLAHGRVLRRLLSARGGR